MDASYRLALRIVIYTGIALYAPVAVSSVILTIPAPSATSADIFIQPRSTSFVEEAYLYGSFARNQQDAASDIDVLVIGKPGVTSWRNQFRNSKGNSDALRQIDRNE